MFRQQWQFRVRHILEAIRNLLSFTETMGYDTFRLDIKTIYAVATGFSIIGEAARHVPEAVRRAHPELPWAKMIRMRNIMVHEYDRIDLEVLWDTLHVDLPSIVPLLEHVLAEAAEDAPP